MRVAAVDSALGRLCLGAVPPCAPSLTLAPRFARKSQQKIRPPRPLHAPFLRHNRSYLHARMRSRTDQLQRVLNRAIPESEAPKLMTLASGKSFVRR